MTDTFNAMSKGSKDYVMLKQGTNTFLLITFLIFNRFSIRKKFYNFTTFSGDNIHEVLSTTSSAYPFSL